MDMLQSCHVSNLVPKCSVQLARQKGAVSRAHQEDGPALNPSYIILRPPFGLFYRA